VRVRPVILSGSGPTGMRALPGSGGGSGHTEKRSLPDGGQLKIYAPPVAGKQRYVLHRTALVSIIGKGEGA